MTAFTALNEHHCKAATAKLNKDQYDALTMREWESGKAAGQADAFNRVAKFLNDRAAEFFLRTQDTEAQLLRSLANDILDLKT